MKTARETTVPTTATQQQQQQQQQQKQQQQKTTRRTMQGSKSVAPERKWPKWGGERMQKTLF